MDSDEDPGGFITPAGILYPGGIIKRYRLERVETSSSGQKKPEEGGAERQDSTTLEDLARRHKKSRKAEKGVHVLSRYAHILEEMDTRPADRCGFIQARLNENVWMKQQEEQKLGLTERARRQQLRKDFGKQGEDMANISVHLAKPKERAKFYKAPVKKDGDKNLRFASCSPGIQQGLLRSREK